MCLMMNLSQHLCQENESRDSNEVVHTSLKEGAAFPSILQDEDVPREAEHCAARDPVLNPAAAASAQEANLR